MSQKDRDSSYEDPRIPPGIVLIGALVLVLAAGIYLIWQGIA